MPHLGDTTYITAEILGRGERICNRSVAAEKRALRLFAWAPPGSVRLRTRPARHQLREELGKGRYKEVERWLHRHESVHSRADKRTTLWRT